MAVTKYPIKNSLSKDRLGFCLVVGGSHPSQWGRWGGRNSSRMGRQENEAAGSHHLQDEAETEEKVGEGKLEPQVLPLRHLLPSTKLCLLKVPQLPQTTPLSGEKVFNYTSLLGSFHTQTISVWTSNSQIHQLSELPP